MRRGASAERLGTNEEILILDVGSKFIDESNIKSNKLSTSSIEIISKKINSDKSIYFAIHKENLLIASNPKIIKSTSSQNTKT